MKNLLRWLFSRTVRRATELRRQATRLVCEQRDLLAVDDVRAMTEAADDLRRALHAGASREVLQQKMSELVAVADQKLKPYPSPSIRDNVREFLVAAVVILGFTTFFLQLTKIPTGSMQPTLFGITSENLKDRPEVPIPGRLARFGLYWFYGISHFHVVADTDGVLRKIEPPQRIFPFIRRQRFFLDGRKQPYTVWFPPDGLEEKAGLFPGQSFRAGEPLIRLRVVSGDHLLVDRCTYNFRRPERGEIIVFKTRGIRELVQDQLYIKRLVALPGERVRIGNDQHLVINEQRLDASDERFENIYTFSPHPGESAYFGHANQKVASRCGRSLLSPRFLDENSEHAVGPRHYLALGDNTLHSLDSRSWGDLPQANVIGKCWFVYWPFTERFGWTPR